MNVLYIVIINYKALYLCEIFLMKNCAIIKHKCLIY